jgi:hypothetical protein
MLQMGHVIYNKATTVIVSKVYKTHAAALAALTRLGKASGKLLTDEDHPLYLLGVAEETYFRKHVEKHRKVVNMMSGVETMEPVNTPNYMSVGSEAYWSS